jgi:hypothetical protein
MSGVEDAVADRIGGGGVGEIVVPVLWVQLARHDRRAHAVTVFENFEEVAPLGVRDRSDRKVVDLCGAPHKSTHVECLLMWSCARDSA